MENPADALRWQPEETLSLGDLTKNPALQLTGPLDVLGEKFTEKTQGFARHLKHSFTVGFTKAVQTYFRELGVHPAIQIKTTDESSQKNFQLSGQSPQSLGSSFDHRFFVNSLPICDVHARSHKLSDGSGLLMGEIPVIRDIDLNTSQNDGNNDWPQLDQTKTNLENSMLLNFADGSTDSTENTNEASSQRWISSEKCYLLRNQKLQPVWRIILKVNDGTYAALANTFEVYKFQPQFFTVDGKATTWAYNRSTEPNVERTLYGLVGDGTLSSEFLKTVVPPEIPRAQEPSHIYQYPTSDRRIEEVTAYANAQDHLRWFQSLGFIWYGIHPLEVRIHHPGANGNAAQYDQERPSTQEGPKITLGDGDGKILQNLATDGDVVSHELGHHIIAKTLKPFEGESMMLHEALSDFFVFSRTGDPCLGETICPAESDLCQQKGKCLRSAANRLVFNDEVWKSFRVDQVHLKSQLISGMMWDMRRSNQFHGNDLALLTLKAASFFAESSNFCQYVRALYAADQELFSSQHWDLIAEVAKERGLGVYSNPASGCSSGTLKIPEPKESISPAPKKTSKKSKCGTIDPALEKTSSQNLGFILILFIFPFIFNALTGFRSLGHKK
jgi:hypothetical protein